MLEKSENLIFPFFPLGAAPVLHSWVPTDGVSGVASGGRLCIPPAFVAEFAPIPRIKSDSS